MVLCFGFETGQEAQFWGSLPPHFSDVIKGRVGGGRKSGLGWWYSTGTVEANSLAVQQSETTEDTMLVKVRSIHKERFLKR